MEVTRMTPGLLASMMMRRNHAVFMPFFEGDVLNEMVFGRPEDRIPKAIDEAIEMHVQAAEGKLADRQVLEEVTGTGFYAPEHEDGYIAMLDQFAGMLALALDKIASQTR